MLCTQSKDKKTCFATRIYGQSEWRLLTMDPSYLGGWRFNKDSSKHSYIWEEAVKESLPVRIHKERMQSYALHLIMNNILIDFKKYDQSVWQIQSIDPSLTHANARWMLTCTWCRTSHSQAVEAFRQKLWSACFWPAILDPGTGPPLTATQTPKDQLQHGKRQNVI